MSVKQTPSLPHFWLLRWDYAGQEVFYNLFHLFLTP